jgi:hypothetical protein
MVILMEQNKKLAKSLTFIKYRIIFNLLSFWIKHS